MIYNKSCRQFLKEYDWMNEIAISMDLEDIKYFYPFSDETTMNVLLWKYKYNKRLPFMQMNIDDVGNVKEFYESNYENEKEITSYVRVPSKNERKHKLFFHGAKGELSNEIYGLQSKMFKTRVDLNDNKFYILTNVNLNRDLMVIFYDGDDIIYQSTNHIREGFEYWFSPGKKLSDVKNLIVKILDDGKLIFKEGKF
jgi:protease II